MQKLKILIFFSISINGFSMAFCQKAANDNAQIGKSVGNVLLNNISNYPTSTARIADFKGKLLIIDFWGVTCYSCISQMPEMEKLQQEFKEKIQVILVTNDSKEKVDEVFHKFKQLKNIDLPSISADTILSQMFPRTALGLHVWIDSNGIVRKTLDGESYSAKEVKEYLSGADIATPERNDFADFNIDTPLWLEGNGRQVKHIDYYSYMAHRIRDYAATRAGFEEDSLTHKTIGVHTINTLAIDLFQIAFSQLNRAPWIQYKRILFETDDNNRFIIPDDHSKSYLWTLDNAYSYNLKVPASQADNFFTYMQEDLERYFSVKVDIEERTANCIILTKLQPNLSSLKSKGGRRYAKFNETEDSILLQNAPIKSFASLLDGFLKEPVFDETGYPYPIDLNINFEKKDFEHAKKELNEYGLDLTEGKRKINFLVIHK